MKKLIFLLVVSFLAFSLPCEAKKKPKGEVAMELTPSKPSENDTYSDSLISVSFRPNYDGYFLCVTVFNRTKDRIYVEWENARINSDKVLFSDDRPITMNQKKEDEMITAGGMMYSKEITSKGKYSSYSGLMSLYDKKDMKKKGREYTYNIILPIRLANGQTKDYKFNVRFYWKETSPDE